MRTRDQLATGRSAHFFLQLNDAKIKQFENGIVVKKYAALSDLAKAGIDNLNSVGKERFWTSTAPRVAQTRQALRLGAP